MKTNYFVGSRVSDAITEAIDEEGYEPNNVFVYGESRGAYASLAGAAQYHCINSVQALGGLILVSPIMSASEVLYRWDCYRLSMLSYCLLLYDFTNISPKNRISTPVHLFQTESDFLVSEISQTEIANDIKLKCFKLNTKTYTQKEEIEKNENYLKYRKYAIDNDESIEEQKKYSRTKDVCTLYENKKTSIESCFKKLGGHCYVDQDDIVNIVKGIEEELPKHTTFPNHFWKLQTELLHKQEELRLSELKCSRTEYKLSCLEKELQKPSRNPAVQGVVKNTEAPATDEDKQVSCNLFGLEMWIHKCFASKPSDNPSRFISL